MALADTAALIASLTLKDGFTGPLKKVDRALSQFDTHLSKTQNRAFHAGEQIGHGISQMAGKAREALTPQDPKFADQLASGLGSMSTFFLPGLGIAKGMQMANFAPRVATWMGISASSFLEASV